MREFLFRERVRISASPAVRLLLSTPGLLALELAFIRWLASQMRVFAYFSNPVLIAGLFYALAMAPLLRGSRGPVPDAEASPVSWQNAAPEGCSPPERAIFSNRCPN